MVKWLQLKHSRLISHSVNLVGCFLVLWEPITTNYGNRSTWLVETYQLYLGSCLQKLITPKLRQFWRSSARICQLLRQSLLNQRFQPPTKNVYLSVETGHKKIHIFWFYKCLNGAVSSSLLFPLKNRYALDMPRPYVVNYTFRISRNANPLSFLNPKHCVC